MEHFGIDVHSQYSEVHGLSGRGSTTYAGRVRTSAAGFRKVFGDRPRSRVVLECGCQSGWVSRMLGAMGHEVIVVNARRVRLIAESTLKCDRLDAEILARLARLEEAMLRPVYQRSEGAQHLRERLRVRSALVRSRTALINHVRGSLRSHGYRMGSRETSRFAECFARLRAPHELRQVLEPLVATIGELSLRIETLHKDLARDARSDELMVRLGEVPGVGPLVTLAFVGWVDRPERFPSSRDVGACLGLRPQVRDSGGRHWRGAITREGDAEMRRLLVQAAHACIQSLKETALKRWAQRLAERAGKSKAIVALARKISVLLHHLWISGEEYRSFPTAA